MCSQGRRGMCFQGKRDRCVLRAGKSGVFREGETDVFFGRGGEGYVFSGEETRERCFQ